MTVETRTATMTGSYGSPVDDQTYDLLQALTSKCEAIEAYTKYQKDASDDVGQIFSDLIREDTEHAQRLLEALRRRLGATS
jgi:hypothetical protein